MAPLVPIVPVAAATRHRIRSRIAGMFLERHALSAADAIPYAPTRRLERHLFDRMRRAGVVREPVAGRFYFDLAKHYDRERRRRRTLVPLAIVVPVILAGIATLFYRG